MVKLKSDDTENVQKKETEIVPKTPIIQEPPGYMASLINKIANNISLKLNNIIFKYIEEDIVMSMNIQLLSIDSADINWKPAFIDINSSKVVLKKIINVTDLTICLDKRNAQGKIDVCQEPILYRCSMQARMIRKYNLSSAHLSSSTRIDIFTDFIDFKVSVQQYPMLIRLYLLIQSLRESRINVYVKQNKTGEGGPDVMDGIADGSYVTWMWNMLPEIFPKDEEDEEFDPQGHVYHTGFYANKVNITLKSQELVSGSIIHSTTSIKYHPFLKITLYGMYFDAITVGRSWYNLKGGISYIGIFPVGTCTCGKKHNLPTIFLSGKKIKEDKKVFLADSLMDVECCENNDLNRVYNRDHEAYYLMNTEDVLLQKTPAIAIDIVSYRHFLDDSKTFCSQSVSEMDYNSTTEEYHVRIIYGPLNFKFDTSLIHLWKTLNEHYEQYDYSAPYLKTASDEITLAQLTPPSTEDFDSLLHSIPLRRYQFIFKQPQIEIYFTDANHFQSKSSNDFSKLPYLLVQCKFADLSMISPLYPSKLVHTTCQLPDPPEKLKTNCFTKLEATVTNCTVDVAHGSTRFSAVAVSNLRAEYETLLKPDFWRFIRLPTHVYHLQIPTCQLTVNKPQLLILHLLVDTFWTNDFNLLIKNMKNVELMDLNNAELPTLQLRIDDIQLYATMVENIIGFNGSCRSVYGQTFLQNETASILFSDCVERDILSFTVQIPADFGKIVQPPILKFSLEVITVNVNIMLQNFLIYKMPWENGSMGECLYCLM